ncbi:trypsin eta-like [Eurosta solidaginis]|uniref:trypsin eta-like n=1 Tax=Eurosta solidaginis TaxID=178769 RepID=UPI0035307E51
MNLRYNIALLIIVVSFLFLTYTNSEPRIINGVDWDIARSPFLVSLNYSCVSICVGSLLTMQRVVTAAHCVIDRDPNLFTIIAGVTDIRDLRVTGQSRAVERIYLPCEFNFRTGTMDIAVIKVSQMFNPSRTVKAIPFCGTTLTLGTELRVSGWGWRRKNGNPSPTLKSTILSVTSYDDCARRYYWAGRILTQGMICAAGRGTSICYGDSGAPGVVDGALCAVVSHGLECMTKD